MKDTISDKQAYKEHSEWHKKQKELLKIAKNIYKKCSCGGKNKNLNKIGDKIYDLMCKTCWDKFEQERKKLKEFLNNKGDSNLY